MSTKKNTGLEWTEHTIVVIYWQVGEIEEVRLVTDFKGKSKGFAYIQFKDEVWVVKLP